MQSRKQTIDPGFDGWSLEVEIAIRAFCAEEGERATSMILDTLLSLTPDLIPRCFNAA
jgi:hypothetical protein